MDVTDVFVESNFLLQLGLRQEQYQVCERIQRGAGPNTYRLHVPQYSLTEVFQTLRPLRNKREEYLDYIMKLFRKSARVSRNAKDSHNTGEIWGATHLVSLASWKSCPKILSVPGFCPT